MKLIPVIDLKDGIVVRGVGGRRHEYRPIVSKLTASCQPVDVAEAFRTHFGLTEIYLADLDAIGGAAPTWKTYADLQSRGFRLWVDAGVRDPRDATALAAAGIDTIVIGLETAAGPELLQDACRHQGGGRIVFSLDLKGGQPLGNMAGWGTTDPFEIAGQAVAVGIRRILVLDLARVGVGSGTGTEDICRRLAEAYPGLEITAGGGIRDATDLDRLRQCGVQSVLVASALHDGKLNQGG